ncbi:MAG: prepilin-type N-terminal cleavage/methylation domain-containing protein [Phycisphaerales bacterium]|nr:prepilin-type N-terminal cleavage/methylation domain-containing protein [Phycisphaerales bacterium]
MSTYTPDLPGTPYRGFSAASPLARARGSDGRSSVSLSLCPSVPLSRRRGITLVELMVVIGIIALVAALALPAFGPMMQSKREAEFVNSLNGLFAMAQVSALGKRSHVALRFERAFETVEDTGLMISAGREANWLDHQQARFLDFATSKEYAFIHDPESKVHALPPNVWVAPGDFAERNLDDDSTDMWYEPTLNNNTVRYSPFDTFYIVFNSNGELTRKPADQCRYRDRTQAYPAAGDRIVQPMVDYPGRPTVTSLVLYDRRAFGQVAATSDARKDFLRQYGRPIYLNRYNAAAVEGRR